MAARGTGFPGRDATDDFLRARRRQTVRRLAQRVARTPGDVDVILPFDEVVAELGRVGERELGLQVVMLDSIVGTVDKPHGFDRSFRPTSSRVRGRWERIAEAMRRGDPIPPVSLYRIGDAHFVRDGHHRVSVARALGRRDIDAYVTEVQTRVGAGRDLHMGDLPVKGHERLFRERVPLPRKAAERMTPTDPTQYGPLAEAVEGWAYRAGQERGELLDRPTAARAFYDEEFAPVVAMLREAGLVDEGETDADAYIRLGSERYQLMRTMDWGDEVIERLLETRSRGRRS